MALVNFDKYFMNLPPFDRQEDFQSFWEKSITAVRKIPLESSIQKTKKAGGPFAFFDLNFRSFMKTHVGGTLLRPRDEERPPVILVLHDYNRLKPVNHSLLDHRCAYFFLTMRGHILRAKEDEIGEQPESPGYLTENILDRETYYIRAIYLDALRSIDMLRLMADLDCSRIGIMGKGLGAAAGIFASIYSERTAALVLDSPSFCNLTLSQNISTGEAAREINGFISGEKSLKKKVKQTDSYYDALNFSDMITCPVMAVSGLRDTEAPAECVFGLFNHLLCEKTVEVYPEDDNNAGGDAQFRKSVSWIAGKILPA
jgi:cephalosporin-C deacetylase